MEQGRSEEDRKQQQDLHQRRMRPPPVVQSEGQVPHHPQPQQPQKCPRCESLNTKFCYYNNYSLAQPRYFCKTCRRYWTQGGTLRNVPVGGGCRKGKRAKASSSSSGGDNSRSQPPPAVLPQQELQVPQNLTQQAMMMSTTSQALKNKEMGALVSPSGINPAMNSYYSGGGFLSSFVAMQSMSQPQPFNPQTLSIGGQFGGGGGASNLALLQGFDIHSQQQQQQNEIYQMGNREKSIEPLYPSDQSLIQPSRPVGSNWNQTLFNNTNPSASNSNFWNSTTSTTTNSNTAGTSVNPADQWPDLPGYGPST